MEHINVRKAVIEDLPSILKILNYEILNGTATFDHAPKELAELQEYHLSRIDNGFPFLVAEFDSQIVGYATYGPFRAKDGYKFTVEHSIYIAYDHQGLGIGKLLLNELIFIAKQANLKSMIAGIDNSNTGSINFHKNFGFQEVGRIPVAAKKFDRWLELIFLQLILE